jgi:hypothetical protein
MNIIFLDIDGVLNCQTFYDSRQPEDGQICRERVGWLNGVCEDAGAQVVISSTWRMSGLPYCKEALERAGATFDIIGTTPLSDDRIRGVEIYRWIQQMTVPLFGIAPDDFHTYVIIDDDSDMLLWQQHHFFQTDNYSGLTPNDCYKIRRFFQTVTNRPKNIPS